MSGGAICDVPWRLRVVEAGCVDDAVGERILSLIDMRVAGEDQIDAVLDVQGLEHVLTRPADCATCVTVTEVLGTMACDNEPGGLRAVDGG